MNKNWLNITLIDPDCSPLVTVACYAMVPPLAGEGERLGVLKSLWKL